MTTARRAIGIDLGTTNCALAHASFDADEAEPVAFAIPQIVAPGQVAEETLLPSFLYVAAPDEFPEGALGLPWDPESRAAVGRFARDHGATAPTKLIASAKSWLSCDGVDRRSPILPWGAPDGVLKLSPLGASVRYLGHLLEAWDHANPERPLHDQDVVLTVPASFDAVAREMTVEAARLAGLGDGVRLLEEPVAALYAWAAERGAAWRDEVSVGDTILVVDLGGGTTDLSLIAVREEDGRLALERLAVGDHILLGGDNIDLALAQFCRQKLEADGPKLSLSQTLALWHTCRAAKERLLADPSLDTVPVAVVGGGSKLIGGTRKTELTRDEVEQVVLEGFFPKTSPEEMPKSARRSGLQEIGLDHAADPAIPRHLAKFLADSADAFPLAAPGNGDGASTLPAFARPTAILFNGGVTKSGSVQQRIVAILGGWLSSVGADAPRVLEGTDLDLAVARGAAYYGLVRRGQGIRIRGGTARSYYIGIETAMPAVPGFEPPIKALCVAPFGMEEGTEVDVPGHEFGLIVGEPSEFRFLSSTHRREDTVGTLIEDWESAGIEELVPVETTLDADASHPDEIPGRPLPVRLRARVTEVGTLELYCVRRDGDREWRLEFEVREEG